MEVITETKWKSKSEFFDYLKQSIQRGHISNDEYTNLFAAVNLFIPRERYISQPKIPKKIESLYSKCINHFLGRGIMCSKYLNKDINDELVSVVKKQMMTNYRFCDYYRYYRTSEFDFDKVKDYQSNAQEHIKKLCGEVKLSVQPWGTNMMKMKKLIRKKRKDPLESQVYSCTSYSRWHWT
jgi:hypothetical protein